MATKADVQAAQDTVEAKLAALQRQLASRHYTGKNDTVTTDTDDNVTELATAIAAVRTQIEGLA